MTDTERAVRQLLADDLTKAGIPEIPRFHPDTIAALAREEPIALHQAQWFLLMTEGYLGGVAYAAIEDLVEPQPPYTEFS